MKNRIIFCFIILLTLFLSFSIISFLEAKDFEDAIRNAVSLGGDADTQAAITGSIASAYWEVPRKISYKAIHRLDNRLLNVFIDFEDRFM